MSQTNNSKNKKKRTYTQKLLLTRKAERIASFSRLILLVANGFWLVNLVMDLIEKQTTFKIILFLFFGIIEIALYAVQKILDKIREENDFEINNFEDTAKYSKKRVKPDGQIDENGEMNINILLKRGSDEPMEDLEKLIGLANVKTEVQKLQALIEYETRMGVDTTKNVCRHYAFLGNPGTGKTTVARIFAGILYQNGRITKNKYLECTGNDLTGEFSGQTKTKVNAIYKRAKGGVLFIDEAYSLCRKGNDAIAEEAVSQLLVHMESDPFTVFIFAGYTNEMLEFLEMNPGLASRVSRQIIFPDYNSDELIEICDKFCKDKKVALDENAKYCLKNIFDEKIAMTNSRFAFSNGRYARNCFDYIYQQHAVNSVNTTDLNELNFITAKDILDIHDELLELT